MKSMKEKSKRRKKETIQFLHIHGVLVWFSKENRYPRTEVPRSAVSTVMEGSRGKVPSPASGRRRIGEESRS